MHFRFFDDLVGSAPGASLEFRFWGEHLAKNYSTNISKKFQQFLKFLKNFLVKFKKNLRKFY